jgi:hypothetical protein
MKQLITALVGCIFVSGVWASELPKELVHTLQRVQNSYLNKIYLYKVKKDVKPARGNRYEAEFCMEVAVTADTVLISRMPDTESSMKMETKHGGKISIDTKSLINSETCYISKDVIVNLTSDFQFQPNTNRVANAELLAYINEGADWRSSPADFFDSSPCGAASGLSAPFFLGVPLTSSSVIRWTSAERVGQEWILNGYIKANDYDPSVGSDYPNVSVRAKVDGHTGLIMSLELLRPLRSEGQWQRRTAQVVAKKYIRNAFFPSRIAFQWDSSSRNYLATETYELLAVEPITQIGMPEIPLGTQVIDSRLGHPVRYSWTGRLLSKDELKQLAYQQGSLLPPETPQRRYSFWMFLPAIVLFGLALLFYLKRRR